jgi:hypothetical protein
VTTVMGILAMADMLTMLFQRQLASLGMAAFLYRPCTGYTGRTVYGGWCVANGAASSGKHVTRASTPGESWSLPRARNTRQE